MKIIDLRIHSIAIADPPLRSSYGLHAPYALRTILELESDDGVVGIAETYGGESPAAALEKLRGRIHGADAYRLTGLLVDLVSLLLEQLGPPLSETADAGGSSSRHQFGSSVIEDLSLLDRLLSVPVLEHEEGEFFFTDLAHQALAIPEFLVQRVESPW